MSDEHGLPQTPEQARELMDRLAFDPAPSQDEEAALLATLPPPGAEIMMVRSLRLPQDTDDAVSQAAQAAGIPKSTWIRQAIEMALAVQAEEDQPISRADALRALTLLRPIRRVA
jgi:predicted DNA-binding protein